MKKRLIFVLLAVLTFSFATTGSTAPKFIKKANEKITGKEEKKKAPDAVINKEPAKTTLQPDAGLAPFDFFQTKFTKAQVWKADMELVESDDNGDRKPGQPITVTVTGPAQLEGGSGEKAALINWGKAGDRYLMFFVQKSEGPFQIMDDIKNDGPTMVGVKLFEKNGKLVGVMFGGGELSGLAANGVLYGIRGMDTSFNLFFSTKALANKQAVTYKPAFSSVDRLSQLQKTKVTTQLDLIKAALADKKGVSNVQFSAAQKYGTMTDSSGNVYKTITIGSQTWMAENLRTTTFRNGEAIKVVNMNRDWCFSDEEKPLPDALCTFKNGIDKNMIATNGLLYNWSTVTDKRNIAPAGWHVPSNDEWKALVTFLGGSKVAGPKLREAGILHWEKPNKASNNSSGFSVVPAGIRSNEEGSFQSAGSYSAFWSKTVEPDEKKSYKAYAISVGQGEDEENDLRIDDGYGFSYGLSVRLIKD